MSSAPLSCTDPGACAAAASEEVTRLLLSLDSFILHRSIFDNGGAFDDGGVLVGPEGNIYRCHLLGLSPLTSTVSLDDLFFVLLYRAASFLDRKAFQFLVDGSCDPALCFGVSITLAKSVLERFKTDPSDKRAYFKQVQSAVGLFLNVLLRKNRVAREFDLHKHSESYLNGLAEELCGLRRDAALNLPAIGVVVQRFQAFISSLSSHPELASVPAGRTAEAEGGEDMAAPGRQHWRTLQALLRRRPMMLRRTRDPYPNELPTCS